MIDNRLAVHSAGGGGSASISQQKHLYVFNLQQMKEHVDWDSQADPCGDIL